MKRLALLLIALGYLLLFATSGFGLAQETGPVVDILGKPEAHADSPDAHVFVSVVDPTTGRFLDTLDADANFEVRLSDQEVDADITPDTTGVAVAIVVDRGGIAKRGDPRIGQAVELASNLVSLLNVDGSPNADMVALIGIRGRDHGGLVPLVPFTDGDPNRVSNEFETLRTEVVNETTPLYDGIDRAIEWITKNPDAQMRNSLTHRRPMIVIFSDGIDRNYSDKAHETIIIQKCLENGILLYTVRMGAGDEDNMEALATQTHGRYVSYTPSTQDEALALFQDIVTQRQSYRVTFPFYKPEGEYELEVEVSDTPLGDGMAETTISSRLRPVRLALVSPTTTNFTVPYSTTLKGLVSTVVPLRVHVVAEDGMPRGEMTVTYFANGDLIGSSSTGPDYAVDWDLTAVLTPTDEVQTFQYTLLASTEDPYLYTAVTSSPVRVRVTCAAYSFGEQLMRWLLVNWWLLIALLLLFIGLIILLIMLIQAKGDARKVVKSTTSALKGMTQRLMPGGPPAQGKLIITQGANIGREFKLANQITKVGRDQQFCDFALNDSFVSNPHFSMHLEQGQFFIVDEGSTNGTLLNGLGIPRHQRVPIQPDALIQVGETQLQFKRLGGETSPLPPMPPSQHGSYDTTPIPESLLSSAGITPPHEPGQESPPGGADERWRGDGAADKAS